MVECRSKEDPSQCFNSLTVFLSEKSNVDSLEFFYFLYLMTLNINHQLYIFAFLNAKHLRTVLLSRFCIVAFEVLGIECRTSHFTPARQAQPCP